MYSEFAIELRSETLNESIDASDMLPYLSEMIHRCVAVCQEVLNSPTVVILAQPRNPFS